MCHISKLKLSICSKTPQGLINTHSSKCQGFDKTRVKTQILLNMEDRKKTAVRADRTNHTYLKD